jgi:hypothetical protein
MDDHSQWPTWVGEVVRFVGTVVAAFVGVAGALWKDRKVRDEEVNRHARYAAIRIVCTLDHFVSDCCNVVDDSGEPGEENYLEPSVPPPTLTFAEDIDWKSLKADLMYRTVSFPDELIQSERIVSDAWDASMPPWKDVFEERTLRYGNHGLSAITLADDYRTTYGIPTRDLGDWDPKERLRRAVSEAEAAQLKRRAKNEEFTARVMAQVASRDPQDPFA